MRHLTSALLSLVLITALTTPSAMAESGYDDLGRPMLGVVMTPPSHRDLRHNDLDARTGVVIRRVYEGSAAEDMGLNRGDIITQINGVEIDSMSTLRRVIQSYQPGDEVVVEGLRGGQPLVGDGFLGGWPESIPFRQIDAQAEARYRERMAERTARRSEQLAALQQEQAALQQEVNQLREANAASPANPAQAAPTRAAADLVSAAWSGNGLALRSLPNWGFRYGMTIGSTEPAIKADTPPNSSPTALDQRQVAEGQQTRYTFAVSDRML